jgi:hypothetical protein
MSKNKENWLDEVCGNCGKTYGSHLGSTSYNDDGSVKYPRNYCPDLYSRMNWAKGPGTVFKSTGVYLEEK